MMLPAAASAASSSRGGRRARVLQIDRQIGRRLGSAIEQELAVVLLAARLNPSIWNAPFTASRVSPATVTWRHLGGELHRIAALPLVGVGRARRHPPERLQAPLLVDQLVLVILGPREKSAHPRHRPERLDPFQPRAVLRQLQRRRIGQNQNPFLGQLDVHVGGSRAGSAQVERTTSSPVYGSFA